MSYFGTIYADTELPSRAKAVYMYLRDRSDAEGKCWPGSLVLCMFAAYRQKVMVITSCNFP